jgi:hypothetical protein
MTTTTNFTILLRGQTVGTGMLQALGTHSRDSDPRISLEEPQQQQPQNNGGELAATYA